MKTLQETQLLELEKKYIELGGHPNHAAFKKKLEQAASLALQDSVQKLEQAHAKELTRPNWAKQAGELAGKGLSFVATLFTFVVIFFGLILGTISLVAAELVAVYQGFQVMDDSWRAVLYSASIVTFYFVILFIQEIVSYRNGYQQKKQFSLRLLLQDALYFVGMGKAWQARYESLPDLNQRIEATVKLVTWSIVVFGVLGRLEGKLEGFADDTWYQALVKIVTESSIEDMIGYVGMVIATLALLRSSKWIVAFISENFRKVTGGIMIEDFSQAFVIESPMQIMEAQKALLLQREILRLESKNKSKD